MSFKILIIGAVIGAYAVHLYRQRAAALDAAPRKRAVGSGPSADDEHLQQSMTEPSEGSTNLRNGTAATTGVGLKMPDEVRGANLFEKTDVEIFRRDPTP